MNFKMLTLATASLLAIAVPSAANAAKPVYGTWGYEPVGDGQLGQAGRRFLGLCERQLGQAHPDRRRPRLGRLRSSPSPTQSEHDVRQIVEQLAADPEPRPASASRSAIIMRASWTQARSKPPAPRRSSPISPRSTPPRPAPARVAVREAGLCQPGRHRHRSRFQEPGRLFGLRRPGDASGSRAANITSTTAPR